MVAQARPDALLDCPNSMPGGTGQNAFLNHLRFVALACRAKARADLFAACALLSMDKSQSAHAHAEALVRSLNDALSKRTVLFRPGVEAHSFDEAWLVRLAAALGRDDESSVQFLLRSRIRPEHRRHIRFLVSRLSKHFSVS